MAHNLETIAGMDDAALIGWLLELLRRTPDVYVRAVADGVRMDTTLRDGLGIDSIGRVCVFYSIVDELGLADDDERAVETWSTVGDVLRFVRARSSKPPS